MKFPGRHNIGKSFNKLKMLALILALAFSVMMWFVVNLSISYQHNVSIPIVACCDQIAGYAGKSHVTFVSARCVASGTLLVDYQRYSEDSPIEVWINRADLQLKKPGLFYITSRDFEKYERKAFGEATAVDVFVDTIYFRFKEESCRKVPVDFIYDVECLPQYMVRGNQHVYPDSILVFGEPLVIDAIESVKTVPVNKSLVKNSIHGTAQIREINGVRYSEKEVEYEIPVTRYVEIVREVALTIKGKPSNKQFSVYPSTVILSLRVPFDDANLHFSSISCYVDYNEFSGESGSECLIHLDNLSDNVISYETDVQTARIIYSER